MKTVPLGRTGIHVSPFCLGTMMFGAWGNPDHGASIAVIDAALDAGINFVDTADIYSDGEAEVIVGKALAGRRDDVVLATKFHNPMGDDPNRRGNSRRWIVRAVDESLARLGTDWIDLYQVHRPDPACDIEETLDALSDLVAAGKIRAFGHSTFPAHLIVEGQWAAERHGRGRFVSEQPPYSLLVRGIEADVLPACERYGVAVLPWSPLGGGLLTDRYRRGATLQEETRRTRQREEMNAPSDAKLEAVYALGELAEEAELPFVEMALAFLLEHPAVTSVILGPRTTEQLESQLAAVDVVLEQALLDRIDEIVPPGTNFAAQDAGWVPPSLQHASLRRRHAHA